MAKSNNPCDESTIIARIVCEMERDGENAAVADLITHLTKGEEVAIVNKNGKQKKRKVFVDDKTANLNKISKSVFKSGKKKLIDLRDVSYIIEGAYTEAFLSNNLTQHADRCFSVVYDKNECQTIDFLCNTAASKKGWVEGLTSITSRLMPTMQTAQDIAECYFKLADISHDDKLSIDEVCNLLKRLHIKLDRRYVKELFRLIEANSDEHPDNQLNRQEFLKFVKILYHCKEIEEIYNKTKDDQPYLNAASLAAFLITQQKQQMSKDDIEQVIARHELSVSMRGRHLMSYQGFRSYLMSEENSVNRVQMCGVYQDMTQPLTNYWMYSSHNTYLIGNQLTGESSTNGYISALRRGCRCVEIDSWDGKDGEPIVTHGWTLTSDVFFRDVIVAIKSAAFAASPYPVILSLDNHCSKEQHKRMAEHMVEILGDSLCTSLYDPQDPSKMLSPEALKHKFLIKGKILKSHPAFVGPDADAAADDDDDDDDAVSEDEDSSDESDDEKKKEDGKKKHAKVAKELSAITAIPSFKLPKLEETLSTPLPFAGVSSIDETKLAKIAEKQLDLLVDHTNKYFIRVYPHGLRTDSSNYNPMMGLIGGCQLVALNMQTTNKYLNIYDGFFTDNGNCGFILKQLSPPVTPPMSLEVQVISGYQLGTTAEAKTRDIIDAYVVVRIHGATEDEAKYETKVVKNNGFNPVWNETFTFQLTRPDVAVLRFIVMDRDPSFNRDDFVSQQTVCVRLLGKGYRNVQLDNDTSSSLLVRITTDA